VHPKLRYTYRELYEVLKGDAHYLLQRAQNKERVDEAILVKATRGDKVLIPPNYGHVTINPPHAEDGQLGVPIVRVTVQAIREAPQGRLL
jgi:oxalate decarboxylase/phosphoglucose isomerase-like protein (cupin superfamily)